MRLNRGEKCLCLRKMNDIIKITLKGKEYIKMKMSEKVKALAIAGVFALVGIGALVPVGNAAAANNVGGLSNGVNNAKTNDMANGDLSNIVSTVTNVFMWVVGVISVIMMIYGGFQYVTSSGDQTKVTKAKNTILYGVVGLAIAILAGAIVSFVINNVK